MTSDDSADSHPSSARAGGDAVNHPGAESRPSAEASSTEAFMSTERMVHVGFSLALLCVVLIGVFAHRSVRRLRESATWVTHTDEVIGRLEALQTDATEAQDGARGYVITGDERYLEPTRRALERMPRDLTTLQRLVADNPGQGKRFMVVAQLVDREVQIVRQLVDVRRQRGVDAARALLGAPPGAALEEQLRSVIGEMKRIEATLLETREDRADRSAFASDATVVLGGVLAFGFIVVVLFAIRRDLTGRRRAEAALRRSEEQLAVTLQSIGDAVLATDTAGRITQMNQVAEQLTGWAERQARGRPIETVFRIINEHTRAPAVIPVGDVLATGQVQGLANHTVLLARDGTERAIADSAAPIRDRQGRIVGIVLVFRDVGAERDAEHRLAAAHEDVAREKARFEFVFRAAPVGLSYVFTDSSGKRTRLINDTHLRLCGLDREEVELPSNFVRVTHPDDRAEQALIGARMERGEIDRFAIDKRYVKPNGQIVWVLLTAERRRHADGSYEDLSVVVDITKRKSAETELERFFSVSLDFLTIAGRDGYFKRVNPTVTDILGWGVDEFLRIPYLQLVHPDDREATARAVERQVVRGEKVLHFENRYRHKDGSWRLLSWRSVPQADGLMYGAARDVTESRQAEEEIRRLNATLQTHAAQLEAANRELEAFTYSVSHDLRAPLRHIQGYVGILQRECERLPDKTRGYLDTIGESALEMAELIDHLLAWSRTTRAEMRPTDVNLDELVAEVREELELPDTAREIQWKIDPLPSVRGDGLMLKQAFVNLLGNAVKYTRPRRVAEIEVGTRGEEDGRVVIFVRDNGVGFDMKYADKLFGVFQRLHRPDEFEGTGIGLANVQRIVLRHGGRIWADAKENAGAAFYFTLPRAGPA